MANDVIDFSHVKLGYEAELTLRPRSFPYFSSYLRMFVSSHCQASNVLSNVGGC